MNKKVWIFQFKKELKAKGENAASWYVGWYDAAGKRHSESCGPGSRGYAKAEKRQRRIQSELDIGVHQPGSRKQWSDFTAEYEDKILSTRSAKTLREARVSLKHFERIVKIKKVEAIKTSDIDLFIAKRRKERGMKPESKVSPATINKDLRHVRAALRVAHDWGYLPEVPKIKLVREPERIPTYVTSDHFALIYEKGCPTAKMPIFPSKDVEPVTWWRALLVTAYMTGLRIGELLALKREDVGLHGSVVTRHTENKGRREEQLPLHPIVLEHLQFLPTKSKLLFPWPHDPKTLWEEFKRIQIAAGIHLVCREDHKHTPACHLYGFHDLRRAFASENASRVTAPVLQKLMRHKSFKTTLGYINLAAQLQAEAEKLAQPKLKSDGPKQDEPKVANPDSPPTESAPGSVPPAQPDASKTQEGELKDKK